MFEQLSDEAMLPHNRERAQALLRKKRKAAVLMVVLGAVAVFVTPPPHGKWALVFVASACTLAMIVLEAKRVLIFRADLRERRSLAEGHE